MRGCTIAGEVRLDNRDGLLRVLDFGPGERERLSDLSVVLAAYERWGEACVSKLLGDFAFAIHDEPSGRAFGARDHLGVKPFYYRATERGLAFATRASAIPEVDGLPLELDERRVADVCVPELECVDATSTFYLGVYRLPPAHSLSFAGGRASVARYWTPDPARELALKDDAEYADAFREVFTEAVRCRLSGATAAMLSGGLDSSAIVGFARRVLSSSGGPRLTTLSAMTDDPGCEESRHIRAVATLPGIDPVAVRFGDLPDYRDDIEAFVASMEEPFDDSMLVPMLMYAAARRRGFGAVLDGVDGDVVASHEPDLIMRLFRSSAWGAAFREARGIAWFYKGTYAPRSSATRLVMANAIRAFAPGFVRSATLPLRQGRSVRENIRESFISHDFAERADVPGRLRTLWAHRTGQLKCTPRERQAQELGHPLIAAALERYYRVGASQGIEVRHPFFDKRLVEFCLSLPWNQKVRDGWSKRLVREAAAGFLPDSVRWRRGRWVHLGWRFLSKVGQGSGAFLARELDGDMRDLAPYADVAKLRVLHGRRLEGRIEDLQTLWTAAILSSWLRKTKSKRYDPVARANGPVASSRLLAR